MNKCTVRTYQEGDERDLALLHRATWSRFGGYVDKSPAQWRRLYVLHPDIGPKQIVVALSEKGTIAGYGAWSRGCHPLFPRTDADGMIYDLALADGAGSWTAAALVRQCVIDSAASGVRRLANMHPVEDRRIRTGLRRCGFVDIDKGYVIGFLVTDPARMLNTYADTAVKAGRRVRALTMDLVQDFSDRIVPFGEQGVLRVEVRGRGKPIRIRCGIVTLTIMMMGGATPLALLFSRQWSVADPLEALAALTTMNALIPGVRFGMPLIDWR